MQLPKCEGCDHPILLSERVRRVYLPTGKCVDMHNTPACVKAWKHQREVERERHVLGYN